MRMLFISNPLFGHFMPMLPLLDAAAQAGHEVVVATGPDLAAEVRRRGLTLWQVGPSTAEVFTHRAALSEMEGASGLDLLRRDVIAIFGWPGYERARALAPLVAQWVPDIVVHDAADYAGYEVGAATGALSVAHGYGPHMPHTVELASDLCSAAVAELGSTNRFEAVLASVYVDPWPAALRSDEPSPWTEVLAIRPEPWRSDPSDMLPAEVTALADRPMLYVTFGTVFGSTEALAMVLEAIRDLPCNVVATTGPTFDPESLGHLPENIVVAPFLPQNQVLALSAAVVSHAGSGTVLGALAAHLPHVCLPLAADQFTNSEQIARHGAGIAIPTDGRNAGTIRAAVDSVLSDGSFVARAAVLQEQIEAMPPAGDVLASLERRAADRVSAERRAGGNTHGP